MTRAQFLHRMALLERERVRDFDALMRERRAPVPEERVAGRFVPPCPPITAEIAAKNWALLADAIGASERYDEVGRVAS